MKTILQLRAPLPTTKLVITPENPEFELQNAPGGRNNNPYGLSSDPHMHHSILLT